MALYEKGSQLLPSQRSYYQSFYRLCLVRGKEVQKNKEKGIERGEKLIQDENATGWYVKGECYRHGCGGLKLDLVQVVACYRRATQMKNGMDGKVFAKFAFGNTYELGKGGLVVDMTAAFENYNYAAKRMHQETQ